MNVLHLLVSGNVGGIEVLCKDYAGLSGHNNTFLFFWASGQITEEMKEEGYDTVEFHASHKAFIKPFIKMLKVIKDKNIDALVTHSLGPLHLIYIMLLRVFCPKLKIYSYMHSDALYMCSNDNGYSPIRRMLFSGACAASYKIIAISKFVKGSVMKWGRVPTDKIVIINNGIDLKKFRYCSKQNDIFTFMYVGRLEKEKTVDYLLKACAMLDFEYKCYIVGDGVEKEMLQKLSEKLNIDSKVIFTGRQRNIPEWHAKADVFIHPAMCEEGFGITLVEAMSSGLPCITFNKGAIPEIIENDKSGFIVDKDSSEALAEKIKYVYSLKQNDPDKWDEIRRNANSRANEFSTDKMSAALDRLLEE